MDQLFQKFAAGVSRMLGSVWTFISIVAVILGSGVLFQFSESWQRVVEFTITIATFLILFFLQKSQNVGDKATHAKLDELIRAVSGARNEFAAVEDKHEQEIDRLRQTTMQECEVDESAETKPNSEAAIQTPGTEREAEQSQSG